MSLFVQHCSAKHLGHITFSPISSFPKHFPGTTTSILADELLLCCELKYWRKRIKHTETGYFLLELDYCVLSTAGKKIFYLLQTILMKLMAEFQILKNFKWKTDLFQCQDNTSWELKSACLMFSYFSMGWIQVLGQTTSCCVPFWKCQRIRR